MKANRNVIHYDLGLVDYKEAWDFQEQLFRETVDLKIANRKTNAEEQKLTKNHLITCQHPHVYTLGKSGNEGHLLMNKEFLGHIGATYYPINRGGDITYHGPGQLVVYPIFDLDHFFTDIHKYMRFLEEAVINTLQAFGITAGRIDGLTGVWLGGQPGDRPRKICAMGVRSSRWVTMHGLALNVNTDLSYFGHIVPCGIPDKEVTSIQKELGTEQDFISAQDVLLKELADQFGILSYQKEGLAVK